MRQSGEHAIEFSANPGRGAERLAGACCRWSAYCNPYRDWSSSGLGWEQLTDSSGGGRTSGGSVELC